MVLTVLAQQVHSQQNTKTIHYMAVIMEKFECVLKSTRNDVISRSSCLLDSMKENSLLKCTLNCNQL